MAQAISAHDLIRTFLDLQDLSPEVDKWSEEHFADNPPRLIRLRRLKALFRAFGISWGPESFKIGRFIQHENPLYSPLLERAAEARISVTASGLHNYFEILFNYLQTVQGLRSFSSGVICASGFTAYAHTTAWTVTKAVLESVKGVEDDLAFVIDPEGRTFTMEMLIAEFDYPDANLSEIDMDWL